MNRICQSAILLSLAVGAGCTHDRPLAVDLQDHVKRPEHAAILLFADGVRRETFRHLLEAGKLPNIKKHLVDRGTTVRNAVSCLPTVTYANTVTFLTGRFPGHHGITGNRFFDRYRLLLRDYTFIKTYQQVDHEFIAPTLYELLEDKYTVSIQCAARRGATRTIDNWATSGINWFFGEIDNVDKLTTIRFEMIADAANRIGCWPEFIHAYFPALDETGHRFGVDSPQYAAAMINLDVQIGRIVHAINKAGMMDRTFLCFVSDHGMAPTPRDNCIDLARVLRNRFNLSVIDKPVEVSADSFNQAPSNYWKLFDKFASCSAVVTVDGSREAAIHLRYDRTWRTLPEDVTEIGVYTAGPTSDPPPTATHLAEHLAALPAVQLAAVRAGANRVRLFTRTGRGDIERRLVDGRKRYRYRSSDAPDALGLRTHPPAAKLIDGQFHTRDQWLAATIATNAPDLIGQLPEMFDSHRSGQVVLFAAPNWDFSPRDIAGHGSILPDDMYVPMILAGPGIPAGAAIDAGRTCDVMPTLLELLGCQDRLAGAGPIDGVSLVERIRQAVIPLGP